MGLEFLAPIFQILDKSRNSPGGPDYHNQTLVSGTGSAQNEHMHDAVRQLAHPTCYNIRQPAGVVARNRVLPGVGVEL